MTTETTNPTKRTRLQSGAFDPDAGIVTITRANGAETYAVPTQPAALAFVAGLGTKVYLMAADDVAAAYAALCAGKLPERRAPAKPVLSKGREAVAHALAHEIVAAAEPGGLKPAERAKKVAAALPSAIQTAANLPRERVTALLRRRDVAEHFQRLHGKAVQPESSLLDEVLGRPAPMPTDDAGGEAESEAA